MTARSSTSAKAKTLEDAWEDMETLREYVHDVAEDARQIQPGKTTRAEVDPGTNNPLPLFRVVNQRQKVAVEKWTGSLFG
ncbi:hypothetical protein C2R22_21170 (plasmid) [Salinigranum rubrum]|uniref:DUF7389 domain-containing protein n=1 Tax=Salinigranum rubrum TaxID=755307 RepID=A0A2I8VQC0_9EURY|nr:hypothetical protein C2R22_21170 [Salinigranum rubrum]